jgi:spermidine synthase
MSAALSIIFLLSGAAALLFETLWFRQAGLTLGNSVWASSLVTSSFMGGLALGNGLAARYGERLRRPLLAYAGLEALIGLAGLGLVLLFPVLTPLMTPVLSRMSAYPEALNAFRLLAAFLLLLIPATAMGTTLPLLVRAVTARGTEFGRALGLLYGWNTLGAVIGALLGEMLLIGYLGIRGTGFVAASINGLAALGAAALWKRGRFVTAPEAETQAGEPGKAAALARDERFLVSAAFLSGAILLALEVVWFRFLLLFVFGSSITFAIMLAVVLFGIATGGILASSWLKWQPHATRFLPLLAFAAGLVTSHTYATLSGVLPGSGKTFMMDYRGIVLPALYLMLPTSLLSGILFTFLGRSLKESSPGATRTTGLLTLANTGGAMIGALLAGFVLLPSAGMERSFLILAVAYGGVAVLIMAARWPSGEGARRQIRVYALAAGVFAVLLALFPFGLMRNHYIRTVAARWTSETNHLASVREGLTETILYLRQEMGGEPVFHRLVTNGFSMSGTMMSCQRYMGMYVYLPIALQPEAKRALQISFGVGNTAKALVDTTTLESIDIVDISRDILDMSRLIRPVVEDPLADRRVNVHIEDGRFFLLTTKNKYDLITAEPPPPKHAGVVNLYSREYFKLIHDRLAEGGVASYWLPVYQLSPHEAKAIVRAFCDSFADCTLWSGYGAEWMLAGTRGTPGPVTEEAFTRQWRDTRVREQLRTVGLEEPEDLGATFIADAPQLAEWTRDVQPLDDNHPHRISSEPVWELEFFRSFQLPDQVRERFRQSEFIRKMWPASLRERTFARFDQVEPLNRYAWALYGGPPVGLPELHGALSLSRLRTPVLWLMGGTEDIQKIVRRLAAQGIADPGLDEAFGSDAMANRDYLAAERHFSKAQPQARNPEKILQWRVLALSMAGQTEKAKALIESASEWLEPRDAAGWAWLSRTFSLPSPE